jgi:hypothetical protein
VDRAVSDAPGSNFGFAGHPLQPLYKSRVSLLVYYSNTVQYYSYIITYSYNVYGILSILALMSYDVRLVLDSDPAILCCARMRCSLQ